MSLVGWWKFDETTGLSAVDSSGGGKTGTLINMDNTNHVIGKIFNGLSFDGVDEYVSIGNYHNFERTDSFSLCHWVKYSAIATNRVMWGKYNSAKGYVVMLLGDGTIRIDLNTGTNSIIKDKSSPGINDGTWHHLAITYNGSSLASGVNLYIDKVLVTMSVVTNNLISTMLTTSPLLLGAIAPSSNTFNGSMDDMRIYDHELSLSEITSIYGYREALSTIVLPKIKTNGTANKVHTGNGITTLPITKIDSLGSHGIPGTGIATLPITEVDSLGSHGIPGTGIATLPILTVSGTSIAIPMENVDLVSTITRSVDLISTLE